MEVYFASNEENNKRRLEEFLKLSKGERLMEFLRMISQPNPFNISLKISPELEIELLTNFNPGKFFDEAFNESELSKIEGNELQKWNIISIEDLISSKISTGHNKDKNDVEVLQEISRLKREESKIQNFRPK